jgi:hypothetical protein
VCGRVVCVGWCGWWGVAAVRVWGGVGGRGRWVGVCGRGVCGCVWGGGFPLHSNIPRSAVCATLDTYNFIF